MNSDVLEQAKALAESGQVDEAIAAYRRIIEAHPEDFKALNNLGVLLDAREDQDAALECYRQAADAAPNEARLHYNLARALHLREERIEAIKSCQRAIELEPESLAAHYNLGKLLLEQARYVSAAEIFERTVKIAPEDPQIHADLGNAYFSQGRMNEARTAFAQVVSLDPDSAYGYLDLAKTANILGQVEEAETAYRRALVLDPDSDNAPEHLGLLLVKNGRQADAVEVYERWLEAKPDHPVALHLLAACGARETPARCADEYVIATFNQFADDFDERMAKLDYQVPDLIARTLGKLFPEPQKDLNILDAGCGTGLCATRLKPYALHLVGVDLAIGMVSKASERQIYDTLLPTELSAYIGTADLAFDVIVINDTLIYFGDLGPLLRASCTALRPSGNIIFTVELLDEDDGTVGFRLNHHGRYSHTADYVRESVAQADLTLHTVDPIVLRTEDKIPVKGLLVVARKPSVAPE